MVDFYCWTLALINLAENVCWVTWLGKDRLLYSFYMELPIILPSVKPSEKVSWATWQRKNGLLNSFYRRTLSLFYLARNLQKNWPEGLGCGRRDCCVAYIWSFPLLPGVKPSEKMRWATWLGKEGLLNNFYWQTLSLVYLAWNPQRRWAEQLGCWRRDCCIAFIDGPSL